VWVAIVIAVGSAVGWRDFKALRKSGSGRERIALVALYLVAFGLCAAEAARVPIPNPLHLTNWLFKPLSDLIYSMSK